MWKLYGATTNRFAFYPPTGVYAVSPTVRIHGEVNYINYDMQQLDG